MHSCLCVQVPTSLFCAPGYCWASSSGFVSLLRNIPVTAPQGSELETVLVLERGRFWVGEVNRQKGDRTCATFSSGQDDVEFCV